MSRVVKKSLTVREVETLPDGKYSDGNNLMLTIKSGGRSRSWSVRYTDADTGRRRQMGIGSTRIITLKEAREKAVKILSLVYHGIDPITQRKKEHRERIAKAAASMSFKEVALMYIEEHKGQWKDKKGAATWRNSLQNHVFPAIGKKAVCEVSDDDVFQILNKIWRDITETATRIRGRIEKIFDYAKAHGWYDHNNPARWNGHLEPRLPQASKIKDVQHYRAVHYDQIEKVMSILESMPGVPAKAVRFNCLTVLRPGVVRATPWSEIDLDNKLWSIPAHRMKMKRAHTVPLTDSAISILKSLLPLRDRGNGDWVFPGQRIGKTLSDVAISEALHEAAATKDVTVHGLRSTFRDWVSEKTDFSPEVAEMALAHEIKNKVEAAYRRGDLLEKRRGLMEAWDNFCTGR